MKIFLIEDNPGDVELIKEGLESNGFKHEITIAFDVEEALIIVDSIKEKLFTPDLIIMDLNIPKGGGLSVLKVLKKNENLKQIPVIVFSSSTRQQDIKEAYALYANCYIVKPFELSKLIETIKNIHTFWFNTVRLLD